METKDIRAMAQRLSTVRQEISQTAIKAGRDPAQLTLIGVTKQFPAAVVAEAVRLGLPDVGENRVEELLEKQEILKAEPIDPRWHLIGTLQRRKVRNVIGRTALIHSVDTLPLAVEIAKRSQAADLKTDILLQVNSSLEEAKHGFRPDDSLLKIVEEIAKLSAVRLRGLMTMAQLTEQPDETLPVFTRTYNLFVKIGAEFPSDDWNVLSMGMSQDYRQAIRCGATHLRIGSAIFGARNKR